MSHPAGAAGTAREVDHLPERQCAQHMGTPTLTLMETMDPRGGLGPPLERVLGQTPEGALRERDFAKGAQPQEREPQEQALYYTGY